VMKMLLRSTGILPAANRISLGIVVVNPILHTLAQVLNFDDVPIEQFHYTPIHGGMTIPITALHPHGLRPGAFLEGKTSLPKGFLLSFLSCYRTRSGQDTHRTGHAQGQWGSSKTMKLPLPQLTLGGKLW
jgi:hypothetical protein